MNQTPEPVAHRHERMEGDETPVSVAHIFRVLRRYLPVIALAMMAWQSYGRWAPALGAVGRFAPAPDWKPELPYGIAVAAGGLHVAATLLAIN